MDGRTPSGRKLDSSSLFTPTTYQLAILNGLQRKRLYQGTVSAGVWALRRRRARMAKASRKANR